MKQPLSNRSLESKLRALLLLADDELRLRKLHLEQVGLQQYGNYTKVIKALQLIHEIKTEIGYKEPEGTFLRQLPLFEEEIKT